MNRDDRLFLNQRVFAPGFKPFHRSFYGYLSHSGLEEDGVPCGHDSGIALIIDARFLKISSEASADSCHHWRSAGSLMILRAHVHARRNGYLSLKLSRCVGVCVSGFCRESVSYQSQGLRRTCNPARRGDVGLSSVAGQPSVRRWMGRPRGG